jgi:enediyne biosynthesis protein E3
LPGLRALRRRILTPNLSATKLEVRGFHEKDAASKLLLETIGATFLTGYGAAVETRTAAECEQQLERISPQFRGFGYEGAAMGYAVLDGLPVGGSKHVARFLAGRGSQHAYMAYIGVGWAMARLPRFRWSRITVADPLMRWLVLDGFGFHQAYFRTDSYVTRQYQEPEFPWPAEGQQWYANHAIDQGIGRALWFVGGTEAELVASMIEKFPDSRQPDLWSGAGLAATYAGGAGEQELIAFAERAGRYRPQVAQGSAFAATARVEAGLVTAHTGVATQVFWGMTPQEASEVSIGRRPEGHAVEDLPAYELWRQRVADAFVSLGRV